MAADLVRLLIGAGWQSLVAGCLNSFRSLGGTYTLRASFFLFFLMMYMYIYSTHREFCTEHNISSVYV